MSRLILPFALLISHFLLINQTASAHIASTPRNNQTITGNLSDSGKVRYTSTTTGQYIIQIIIPSKTVCRQKISTFFIVAIPDTLFDQRIAHPEKPLTLSNTTNAASIQVNGINIGGGSHELELLLKTPGRVTSNPALNNFTDIATITRYLSLWATSFLYR